MTTKEQNNGHCFTRTKVINNFFEKFQVLNSKALIAIVKVFKKTIIHKQSSVISTSIFNLIN